MASHNFSDVQALNRHVKLIAGRWDDADALVNGLGFTAANTGTGTYTITLDQTYPQLLSVCCQLITTTGADDYSVTVVSETVATDGKINIEVHKAAVLTDLGTGDEVSFIAVLQNSSLPAV